MAEFSLGEYLAQSQRSMGGGYFGRTSGPMSGYLFGPDFFKKADYLQLSDTFVATYGKKVWDALNNKTVTFNAIKKVDWGATVGWRLRTARYQTATRSNPITETGALPTVDNSTYIGIIAYPKIIGSTFGVSLKAQAVSALEGGIGNQFAVEQEATSRDHIKEINLELVAGGAYPINASGTVNTRVFTSPFGNSWRVGDTVDIYSITATAAQDETFTVTAQSATTLTGGTGGGTGNAYDPNPNDVVFTRSRAGLTSIDDVVAEAAATVGGQKAYTWAYTLGGTGTYTRTAAGPYAAATANYNSGVGRDLSLPLVDTCFELVRQNGGEPKLIVTGLDQYDNFNQLLQAQQRFMDISDFIVGVGDDRTYPGTRAGFQLATYRGVPILPDPDTAKSMKASGGSYAALGTNLYVFDTDYMEIGVMYPTQYVENRDYFAANALVIRGLFMTMAEFRCLRPDVQAKIADLNA